MQINTDIFSDLITCKNGVPGNPAEVDVFVIDGTNGNPETLFRSGKQSVNNLLDESISPWLINENSCLHYFTFRPANGDIARTAKRNDTPEPLLLQCGTCRYNTSTYQNVLSGGSILTNYETRDAWNMFNSNYWTVQGNTPLWYLNAGTTGTGQHFSVKPFILDFDYNGILLTIHVDYINKTNVNAGGVGAVSTSTLADYIANNNNVNNEIVGIWFSTSIGTPTLRYGTAGSSGVNSGWQGGLIPYLNKKYAAPTALTALTSYPVPDFFTMRFLGVDVANSAGYARTGYDLITFKRINNNLDGFTWGTDSNRWVNKHSEVYDPDYVYLKKSGDTYTDDDFDYIRREIAYLGFWFSDGDFSGSYTELTTPLGTTATDDVYMSVISEQGVTTGEFIKGSIAKDTDQAAWGTDFRDRNGYNGRIPAPGGNTDRGNLSTVLQRGSIAAGCKWYGLNATQLNALVTWINSGYQPASNDQFVNDFKGVNPSEYITSVTYMPCYPIPAGTDEQINIGPLSTSVQGRKISYEYGVLIDVGSIALNREYNDFRDYKPYTAVSLYVPYCGTIELDPANYYGRVINVKLMVDMSTGTCTGLIFANDLLIDSIQGQCGISIPLAAFNMGEYQNAIVNAQYQLKQAQRSEDAAMVGLGVSMIGGTLTATTGIGLAAGIAGSIYSYYKLTAARDNIENIEYNIEHMQPKQSNISTGSPTNSQGFERDCRLIITRPNDLDTDIAIYGHTVGYMTNKQGLISDFHGFTQCSNADLSGIGLTSSEITAIHEALKKGVYLP